MLLRTIRIAVAQNTKTKISAALVPAKNIRKFLFIVYMEINRGRFTGQVVVTSNSGAPIKNIEEK